MWGSRSLGNSTMVGLCNHQQSTIQIKLAFHRHRRRKLVKHCLLTIWKSQHFNFTQTPNWGLQDLKLMIKVSSNLLFFDGLNLILFESLYKRGVICCSHMYGHEWPRKLVWQGKRVFITFLSYRTGTCRIFYEFCHLFGFDTWYSQTWYLKNLAKLVFPKWLSPV